MISDAAAIFIWLFLIVFFGVIYFYNAILTNILLKKAKYKRLWAAWIPVYQNWAISEIAGKPGWWSLIFHVPYLMSVIYAISGENNAIEVLIYIFSAVYMYIQLIIYISLAKSFGKSIAYAIGLLMLPFPMYLIFTLSAEKYKAPKKTKKFTLTF